MYSGNNDFCSNECYHDWRKGKNTGKNNPMWNGGGIECKCNICNKIFYKSKSDIECGSFSIEEWHELKRKYKYTCPCCKRSEPEINLTIDHIIPISKGGNGFISNIQPLCKSCNCRKHNKEILYEVA